MSDPLLVESLVSRASGSAGSFTWGHNQHGPWVRDRQDPTDPATGRQTVVRNALATIVDRWAHTLTQAERQAWDVYALNVFTANRMHRQTHAGGLPMYVRSNVPRLQTAHPRLAIIDAAPVLFDRGDFPPITTVYFDDVEDTVIFFFDDTSEWCSDLYAAMIVWSSVNLPTTRNFYKGPYQILGLVKRTFPGPAGSPAVLRLPVPPAPTDRVFLRARITRSDGRLSADQRFHADLATGSTPYPTALTYLGSGPHTWRLDFSGPLLDEPMNWFPWRLHWANVFYDVGTVTWNGSSVLITGSYSDPGMGADYVFYLPTGPPIGRWFQLHDASNHLAVPQFHYYP